MARRFYFFDSASGILASFYIDSLFKIIGVRLTRETTGNKTVRDSIVNSTNLQVGSSFVDEKDLVTKVVAVVSGAKIFLDDTSGNTRQYVQMN